MCTGPATAGAGANIYHMKVKWQGVSTPATEVVQNKIIQAM